MPRPFTRRAGLRVAGLSPLLLLASCGVGAPLVSDGTGPSDGGAPNAPSDGGGATGAADASASAGDPSASAYRAELEKLAQTLRSTAVDAPQEVTGPSEAATVPEVQPISDPSAPSLPVTLTDYQGTEVTVTDTSRLLALDLYGTLADTVVALGQGDRLVGRVASTTQESLAHLPLVTENGHDLNIEAILERRPTLVLMDTTNGPVEITEQLRSAGVSVVHFTPDRTMDGIADGIRKVAAALGVPADGERLAARVTDDLDYATTQISEVAPPEGERLGMAFLYVRGTAGVFFILGEGSGADDLITAISGRDAAGETGADGILPANAEALAKLNPDLILAMTDGVASTGGLDGFLARPGVAQTVAGQRRRVVTMADGQILSFGPNTPAVLLSLATAVYGPADAA